MVVSCIIGFVEIGSDSGDDCVFKGAKDAVFIKAYYLIQFGSIRLANTLCIVIFKQWVEALFKVPDCQGNQ